MEEELGLTVQELFRIAHFKEAELLGGESGLEQRISRINVMEVPDVIDWVRPGEFLITTGYPFRNNAAILAPLIAQLAERGVVALGIKTARFIGEVPADAIEAADRHGLPLIELPPDMAFSDVVRSVMERVLVAESRQLSTLQSRVQRLSQVLLHGGGLSAFLEHLELLVRNPVCLLEPGGRWMASPLAEEMCRQTDPEAWDRLRRERTLETGFVKLADRSVRAYVTEIEDGRQQPFLLILLEAQVEYGIVDTLTMNWAGELVGFEISNAQARSRIEAKYVDQFVQDWLAGRIISPVDLRLRAEACGSPIVEGARYVAGILRFREERPSVSQLQELARRMAWDTAGESGEPFVRWTVLEEELTILLSLTPEPRAGDGVARGEAERQAASTAGSSDEGSWTRLATAQLARFQQLFPDLEVQLCLGRSSTGQSEVPTSYREAKRTAEVALVCSMAQSIVRYDQLGVYLLLYRLRGTPELEEFKATYLEPLLRYDARHQGSLLHTLRIYFACNGNARETANRLFIHYNTVTYRLERIRTELGLRLDDPEARLQLQLAVKLYEIQDYD
ncbi:PucR family transcriptional regulator [Paenibacillus sp. 598K]|uniref:PucR family transcriptional regulator n=1 Tax=Paenibacillus sp. 598K TaxID=1117987 RepID=UPI000FFA3063|nr:PucR family transcriptional regulator [Paenibacillus sp. 598K]GBF76649.1 PucR family transcriptional regulator [Paenibacillus sp. 598K]